MPSDAVRPSDVAGRLRDNRSAHFAHRGPSALAPENTLEASAAGARGGRAGGLELDVHIALNGESVVIHDTTVERTTEGSGIVAETVLDELRPLDTGYRFRHGREGARIPTAEGVRIPTLFDLGGPRG